MPLKFKYDDATEFSSLSEELQGLYTEKDGTWVLSGIEGVAGPDDVKALRQEAGKYRIEKNNYSKRAQPILDWMGDRTLEDIQAEYDQIEELKLKAEGSKDQKAVEKLVQARLNTELSPLQRKLQAIEAEKADLAQKVEAYSRENNRRTITDAIRAAGSAAKCDESTYNQPTGYLQLLGSQAFEVVEGRAVVKEDNPFGLTPGLEPEAVLAELKPRHPHLWPASRGGGAGGSVNGTPATGNPWSKDSFNLTMQGKIMQENPKLAEQLKNSAKH